VLCLKLDFLFWNSCFPSVYPFSNCSINICSFMVLHGNAFLLHRAECSSALISLASLLMNVSSVLFVDYCAHAAALLCIDI
jgi:hypothetical protein